MRNAHAPLLLPAAALFLGVAASTTLLLSTALLVALVLAGLAWRCRAGTAVAWIALGALLASARTGDRSPWLDPGRPIEAQVRTVAPWTSDEYGWTAPARLLSLRQGRRLGFPGEILTLRLPDPDTAPPAAGATLRVRGYLSPPSRFANGLEVPPGRLRLSAESRLLVTVEDPAGPLARLAAALRRPVERAFTAAARPGSPGVALARALVLGDGSDLPEDWKRGLRLSGLYHLLSVSGVHVALLGALVAAASAFFPRGVRLGLVLAALALYVLLVGPLPPLLRSAVMGALVVAALLVERPPALANALAAAVLLFLALDPKAVDDLSFVLSAVATAGLFHLAPAIASRLPARLGKVGQGIAASLAAQIATLPWLLPRTFLLSPAAPLLNLLAVPWTGVFLAAAFAWTGVALVSPAAAAWLVPLLDLLAAPFGWPARLAPSPVWLFPVALGSVAAWSLALCLGLALAGRGRKIRSVAALAAALLVAWGAWRHRPPAHPEIAMIDVGQGDAILVRDGTRAVLVDGGGFLRGDIGGRVLLPTLLSLGVRRLDAVAMTHPDADHCAGLVDVSAYLPVGEVWMGPGWPADGCAGRLASSVRGPKRLLWAGQHLTVGRWKLSVLHPEETDRHGENERSLVVLAEAFGRKVLLTGDAEVWAEMRLLSCCEPLFPVDVLKVAHHGSKSSTSESFLAAARPRLALISAGVANRFHHPSPVILERLEESGARLLRTDRDGMIRLGVLPSGRMRITLPGTPK